MSDTPTMISAIVTRDFRDDGTKRNFTASDKPVQIEEGAFANYEAAGLVTAAPADTAAKSNPDTSTGSKPKTANA
jgi:hypothetical protein